MYKKLQRVFFDGFVFAYFGFVAWVIFLRPSEDVLVALKTPAITALVLFAIGSVLAAFLLKARVSTLGHMLFAPIHLRPSEPVPWYRSFWVLQTLLLTLITIYIGIRVVDVNLLRLLDRDALVSVSRLFRDILNPDWGVLPEAIVKIIETILIAFMATLIAVPVAFILSFFCAKNIMGGSAFGLFVYGFLRTSFNVMRSIEPILWAIIFAVWVSFGPFAGMLALMVHSVASLAKQFSEIVECVNDGPLEGIRATGAGFMQVLWFAVVPQVVLPYISFTIYRWDINVRMATILGFVGGGGIGEMLLRYQRLSNWPQVGTIIVVVAVVVWLMDSFSAYVREAIK